jgi:hypothetical protein
MHVGSVISTEYLHVAEPDIGRNREVSQVPSVVEALFKQSSIRRIWETGITIMMLAKQLGAWPSARAQTIRMAHNSALASLKIIEVSQAAIYDIPCKSCSCVGESVLSNTKV